MVASRFTGARYDPDDHERPPEQDTPEVQRLRAAMVERAAYFAPYGRGAGRPGAGE